MTAHLQGLFLRDGLASIGGHAVGVLPQAVQLMAQSPDQILSALLLLYQHTALLLRL